VYSVPTPSGRRSILADVYPFALGVVAVLSLRVRPQLLDAVRRTPYAVVEHTFAMRPWRRMPS
jgi:hypothetical protein